MGDHLLRLRMPASRLARDRLEVRGADRGEALQRDTLAFSGYAQSQMPSLQPQLRCRRVLIVTSATEW